MISSAVFARYARALADVALETGQDGQVLRDLETYAEIFKAVPDLLPAFDSPAVPREAKEKLLSELFVRYPVCRITANFLRVLLGHHRLRYFLEICERYIRIVNERKGIVFARVRSAAPLSDRDLAVLRESLSRATGKSIAVELRTEPELLGGLIVQIGSIVYDGSIRTQLDEMKRCLAGG
jgi:F-type H+-transporting ATPase subunit delta